MVFSPAYSDMRAETKVHEKGNRPTATRKD